MLRRIFGKSSSEHIAEELQAHLDIEIQQLVDRGFSRSEAEVLARRLFGNRTRITEDTRSTWRSMWLDRLLQDLRYGVRSLLRNPIFLVSSIISLALGIGASTAVFSIPDTVFLRPLPYVNSQQLMWVGIRFPGMKTEFLASPDYVAWRRDNHVFRQLAATQARGGETMLLNGIRAREVHAVKVSSNFLSTFGIKPVLGRDFTPGEELPNGPKAVLLSYELWLHRFRKDVAVMGQTIRLDGNPYTVAGILPASFVYPMDVPIDVLITLPVSPTASHHDSAMMTWAVYGRLKPGITLTQARADMDRLFALSKSDIPLMFRSDSRLVTEPLQQHRIGDARLVLGILIGAVGCLLLIACANVANLLLARWSARSAELAVRSAIGAGRWRLARQLLTETLFLTAGGCVLGTGLLALMLSGFRHYAVGELPRLSEITIDARVFAIGILVSLLTTIAFGAIPVLRAGKIDIRSVLQESGRVGRGERSQLLWRGLVVAEVSLSLVLLSGAALLLQTLWHLRNDHLGFQPEHLFTISIPLQGTGLESRNRGELVNELVNFARRIPGNAGAAVTECNPLSGGPLSISFSRSDRPLPEAFHRGDTIRVCGTGSDYAKTVGLHLVRGRFFSDDDLKYPNTLAVINEAAVRAYLPGEDPIGKQIIGGPQKEWKTIVGVVSDTKNQDLNAEAAPQAFINGITWPSATAVQMMVRSEGDQRNTQSALIAKLRSLDPGVLINFQSLDTTISQMTAGPRFNSFLVTSFAAIALLMAIVGVYGVLAFAVTQRTHEIGIRMALGAEPSRMFGLVLGEGTLLVGAGVIAGFAGVLFLTRYLKALLYGVHPADPLTLLLVGLGLMLAAGAAMVLPACRAASVDPVIALRHN